jgi:hypothetical protein
MAALSWLAWAFILGLLWRRAMFGPQKQFARLSFGMLLGGEVCMVIGTLAPEWEDIGIFVEAIGFVCTFIMFASSIIWNHDRRQSIKKES